MTARQAPGPAGALTLADIRGAPLRFLTDMRRRYGDVVEYGTGDWTAVLVSHPEGVRHILVENVRNYRKQGTPDLRMLKPMLGDGLLTSDGEAWRAQRHILAPLFKRHVVERFGPLITEEAAALAGRLTARGRQPIEVAAEMNALTLRIVARALFSHDASGDAHAFGDAVEILNEAMGGLSPQGEAASYHFAGALAVIHDVVESASAARRKKPGGPIDALGLMLEATDESGAPAMTDRQLIDQSVTLLLAGHETTAKALTWTLHLVSKHPDVARRLDAELGGLEGRTPTVEDLPRLPFCAAVLKESMRLYTPIWIVSRIAIADDEVDGYRIPAGALLPISPYLVHRHEAFWPDAETFKPDRFMGPEAEHHHPQQFMPFGAGPRHCIGRHFATIEMQLVLAVLLQSLRFEPTARDPEPEALVTLRPKGGLWMRFEPREP